MFFFSREIDVYFWNMKMKNGKCENLTRFIFMILDSFMHNSNIKTYHFMFTQCPKKCPVKVHCTLPQRLKSTFKKNSSRHIAVSFRPCPIDVPPYWFFIRARHINVWPYNGIIQWIQLFIGSFLCVRMSSDTHQKSVSSDFQTPKLLQIVLIW